MDVYENLTCLIEKSIEKGFIKQRDWNYAQNRVLYLLGLEAFPDAPAQPINAAKQSQTDDKAGSQQRTELDIPNLLENLVTDAVARGVIENVLDDKEMLAATIMDCFVERPSTIESTFWQKYNQSPESATQYFYELSKSSNYIQMKRIRKNIHFKTESVYGDMDITINLSKPEKGPEQIRREREMKQDIGYPKCVLCRENEGYAGRVGHPPRANHRIIRVPLSGEDWYLQYSPYVYYNEHSIVLSEQHRPMKIDKTTFKRLVEFTEKFPHYMIGSNADLPIVGGSILNHDHYQAGRYEFAMAHAADEFTFELDGISNVSATVLKWPMSVIRLRSLSKKALICAADLILSSWKNYSDNHAGIQAFTGETPHNTITPIARMCDGQFEMDLVLRNNRTNNTYPMGIFHPHEDVQHIKKENIGLIEVMGLAVLPARLRDELQEIKEYLLAKKSDVTSYHAEWAEEMKNAFGDISDPKEADAILKKELGRKFARVLEDCSVFKNREAFTRFIQAINT